MTLDRERDVARQVAIEAAALVMTYWRTALEVDKKTGDEPVTVADRAANAFIVARLQAAFPQDTILSEEIPDDGGRLGQRRVWMVDPIDGTRDFIAGDTGWAVMIGLCIEGRPQVGVLALGAFGEVLVGVAGQGGWKEDAQGQRHPLRTSILVEPPGIRLVASKTHRTKHVDSFRQALGIEDELNVGSIGLKVAMVADGRRDLYVYPGGRTKLWDACAPEAVLLAAGGRLTDVHGHLLDYTSPDLANRTGLVASNGPLHDRVIDTLRPLIAQRPVST
jgi:3'(2'), 5'-bisphosphate nucleotidase